MSDSEQDGGLQPNDVDDPEYDVMISYSHADSKAVAEELHEELTAYGWDVWYDEVEMQLGDDIQESINRALNNSRHAVILISPSYFEGMSQLELGGLVQIHKNSDRNVILPLPHKMSFEELQSENPMLAGILGTEITEGNVPEVVAEIHNAIESDGDANRSKSSGATSRVDVDVTLKDLADISIGTEVTIHEWRTEGTPHDRGVIAVKMELEDSGLTYSGSNYMGRTKVIKDEPLNGHVSDISDKSSGETRFTLRIPQERMDELSDDRDDYKQVF